MAGATFPCKHCAQTFHTQTEWKAHLSTEHDVIGYPCDLCTEVFYKERDYIQHFNGTHKSDFNRHVCQTCGVSYKWFKFLVKHIEKKHQVETLMQCDHCGEDFYNTIAFRQHLKLKHAPGKKFHKCNKCRKSFTAKSFLHLHEKFDHNKRGAKLFKEYVKYHLNLDESLLNSTKNCSRCNLQFSSYIYLFKHFKQTHDRKKYFLCCACNEAIYNTRAGLSIHLHYEHGIAREHKCVKCVIGHLTPPKIEKKINPEKSIVKEESAVVSPPWTDKFKKSGIPDDLNLVDASDAEISNLRSNIRELFHLLSTVAPSRLKSFHRTEEKTDTCFSMKSFKSPAFKKAGIQRYALKPQNLQFDWSIVENGPTTKSPSPVAEQMRKEESPLPVAEEMGKEANANVNNVKQKLGTAKVQFKCHKCSDEFTYRKALNAHVVKVHGFQGFSRGSRKSVKERQSLIIKCEEIEKRNNSAQPTKEVETEVTPKCTCNICNTEFTEQTHLFDHLTEHHTADPNNLEDVEINIVAYKCADCYAGFNTENELGVHMKDHAKHKTPTQYENAEKVCEQHTAHPNNLEDVEINIGAYKCADCYAGFNTENELGVHMKDHAKHKMPTQDENAEKVCKQHTTHPNNLEDVEINIGAYKCADCYAVFNTENELGVHMKDHAKHKTPTQYENAEKVCKQHTAHPNNLENAEINVVVYKCPDCYGTFNTENELGVHMNDHANHKTPTQDENAEKMCKMCKMCKSHIKKKARAVYRCLKCDKRFERRIALRRHIQKEHKIPTFKCTKCKASYRAADKLKQHQKFKHDTGTTALPVLKIQKSKLSPVKLDKLPNILSNILTRNLLNGTLHSCKICNSYFPSNVLLQRHIQWEHTKNVNLHKCGQCNQVLYSVEDLELHMSVAHNNEGPFKWKKQIAFNYEKQTDI